MKRLNYEACHSKTSLKSLIVTHFPLFRFLEGDEDEDTCTISQEDIADAVDIASGAKVGF